MLFNDESDLLVRGTAAAQANDREEATFYLEWLLTTDADLDQKADAWYWLSKCTDDPAEKRNRLENALSMSPTYPEARRDLAVLDGRLQPDQILDPRRVVAPLTPSATVSPADAGKGMCPRCGAKMMHNPLTGALTCQFCGYTLGDTQPATGKQSGVEEQDWVSAIYTAKGHRWEMPTSRTLKCSGCGATVSLAPAQISTSCPFCGAPYTVQEAQEREELIQPEGVILFAFDGPTALQYAHRWLADERFMPRRVELESTFAPAKPIYLPFWTFQTSGEIHWRRAITRRENGQIQIDHESGSDTVTNDEIVVPGTRSLPDRLLLDLHYDMGALRAYSPDMLVNWPAEVYSISAADASIIAHKKACKAAEQYLSAMLNAGDGELQTDSPLISVASYKLLLLPLWLTQYTYRGETFSVAINGQTGEAHGDMPRNALAQVAHAVEDLLR